MYVLYRVPKSPLEIAEVPAGETGERFVARISHAIHISNHATRFEAEQAKEAQENPQGNALEQGGKFSA